MDIDPVAVDETYRRHEQQYQYIQNRLRRVREAILDAPAVKQQQMLFLADTYALITANTSVEAHDLALAGILRDPDDLDHVAEQLKPEITRARQSDNVVLYYNNKAEFIRYNAQQVDYEHQAELFANGDYDELHTYKVEHVKGLRPVKAAFSLAQCGITQKACLDGNMVRKLELRDVDLQRISIEDYDALVDDAQSKFDAVGDLPAYLWQWVTWDHVRESAVTTHDAWFIGAGEQLNEPALIA